MNHILQNNVVLMKNKHLLGGGSCCSTVRSFRRRPRQLLYCNNGSVSGLSTIRPNNRVCSISTSSVTFCGSRLATDDNNNHLEFRRLYWSTRATLQHNRRSLSTTTTQKDSDGVEKLRIAIVGGGCAGLCTALHLAELVEHGSIDGPIDVYTTTSSSTNVGRNVGVGIWSTAVEPFQQKNDQEKEWRPSYQYFYETITQYYGTYSTSVGYRIPNGSWLLKSQLPDHMDSTFPSLLFLRENDFLELFIKTITKYENEYVKIHNGCKVTQLYEDSQQPYSTNIQFEDGNLSDRDYHCIIAADGTHSLLRQRYAGHDIVTSKVLATKDSTWYNPEQHNEIVAVQDRNYTVFRGNAPISNTTMQQYNTTTSFQTWGEGYNMRFATVPMRIPNDDSVNNGEYDDSVNNGEYQVWFITITNEDNVSKELDAIQRKQMLLEKFKSWHEPITTLVNATPPEEIYMDRAISHKHNVPPVLNFNTIVTEKIHDRLPSDNNNNNNPRPPGPGPCLIFHGDAYMTIDPILAQGFTCAMEGSYSIKNAIKRALTTTSQPSSSSSLGLSSILAEDDVEQQQPQPKLGFDPIRLRQELQGRHLSRVDRLKCVLQITELVQWLGQPNATSFWSGWFNRNIIRPITQAVPNIIKQPIFNMVLQYSLGRGIFVTKSPTMKSQ